MKANFDGAANGNPGISGVGVILRDNKGHILLKSAKKLPRGTNNIVECQATLLAVRLARREGIKKIHLEGDSLLVVQAIAKIHITAWHLEVFINQIVAELSYFEEFKISHIKREGNEEADFFIKMGSIIE